MGKYFQKVMIGILLAGVIAAVGMGAEDSKGPKEPIFIFLYARMTDHVNLDLTQDRLRHLLPEVEKYRKEHPEAHATATVLFTGAVSEALERENSTTHIVDFVKDYIKRGIIEPGYDGENEPTFKNRPTLDFSNAKSIDDRWTVRAQTEERILKEARDPLTGAPETGKDGGLKKMQEVFGEAAYIAGVEPMLDNSPHMPGQVNATTPGGSNNKIKLPVPTFIPEIGGDSESVRVIQNYNKRAILAGFPEDNVAELPGFGGDEQSMLSLVSPAEETSPEVYWQDNMLRLSEVSNTSEAAAEAAHDFKGLVAEDLKDDLGDLNRGRIQVVRVELADERYYLQRAYAKDDKYPLQYAYNHPDNPKLPSEQRADSHSVEIAYGKELDAIDWLAQEFFPANAGSRFVACSDIRQITEPSTGYRVSIDGLRTAVKAALAQWGNDTFPPTYIRVEGHYLSLADWFQVMTDALAEMDRTGKLPESVEVVPVYGPMYTPTGHGPNAGDVTAAAVAHAAAGIAPKLHDMSGGTVPKNCIPVVVAVSSNSSSASVDSGSQGVIKMSAAQFLRLMAKAIVAPSSDTSLQVRMTYMFPTQAMMIPKTRTMGELGAMWTLKPAQLQIGTVSQSAQVQK